MLDNLTTIATFETAIQARIAKNELEAAGIEAFVANEEVMTTIWHLGVAIGGVKLQVSEKNAQAALVTLENIAPFPDDAEDEAFDDDADDEKSSPTEEAVARAFRAAMLGLLFWPLHLYSIWLLATAVDFETPLSAANRWRIGATVLLSLPGVLGCLLVILVMALMLMNELSLR